MDLQVNIIICGDWIEVLKTLPDEIFHCVVTSPPYWGQRNYGVEGQLGMEKTPEEHIEKLVEGFREIRRVLRSDGVLWLNYGDKYCGSNGTGGNPGDKQYTNKGSRRQPINCDNLKSGDLLMLPARVALALQADGWILRSDVIWAKALSFCDEYSGSTMPESVNGWRWERHRVKVKSREHNNRLKVGVLGQTPVGSVGTPGEAAAQWKDCPGCEKCEKNGGLILRRGSWRCTKGHEYIFQLVKSNSYFCDMQAVSENCVESVRENDIIEDYENEDLFKMQIGATSNELSERAKSKIRSESRVQRVREETHLCVEENSKGQRINKKNRPEIQKQREWKEKKKSLSKNGEDETSTIELAKISGRQKIYGKIPQNEKAENRIRQIQQESKRKSNTETELTKRTGKSETFEGDSQEKVESGKLHKHFNGGGVGDNTEKSESQVLLLQDEKETDARPCSTTEQGGQSRQRKHSGSLSNLQCEQGCKDNNTVLTSTRNLRDVWVINPQAYPDVHYATFPTALVEPCIKVSTSQKGVCPKCGAPWARIVKVNSHGSMHNHEKDDIGGKGQLKKRTDTWNYEGDYLSPTTLGWKATCDCGIEETEPALVLDPFMGSGTVGMVAAKLGRNYTGIEINPDYIENQVKYRLLEGETGITKKEARAGQGSLFGSVSSVAKKGVKGLKGLNMVLEKKNEDEEIMKNTEKEKKRSLEQNGIQNRDSGMVGP